MELTDLEIVQLCAEANGWDHPDFIRTHGYDPLRNKAQCFALVERFALNIVGVQGKGFAGRWGVYGLTTSIFDTDLSRAICLCCARMWLDKKEHPNG